MSSTSHILLIDDDEATNFVNKSMINKSDMPSETKAFLTAQDGLEHLRHCIETGTELPGLIFLDINMPQMNGWQFMEEFSKFDPSIKKNIKIYMLSGTQNKDDAERATDNPDISGLINKPLMVNGLEKLFG